MKKLLLLALLIFFISISSVIASNHRGYTDHENAHQLVTSGDILPLGKILELVYKRHRGKILEVELELEDNTYSYEIELLDDNNKVWEIDVDAVTGKILKIEEED
ncbi:MAG: PepSY domain-containing protein [gamma proteobacterium symbiont of Bathyaustriella thionipta]|nr:PepSY domain-containing protein [gamma proteobacterium symbiont of Bathyaustriella thionipta]MCU7949718.1 PepSY domain-containing protein [gamma proteobacterium symbiont of Bathyaustriella thionipta]MCU7952920.1 PepSY domain-containing protein [gamma proteobacterium symbiont of Bathyaustriella thionipta]MCU7956420.1 PepSY domain-containing protein [gamma proteobacterium symbiont of Bathyaustriella thionipta]MCU7967537.1 PepSY domain-containing protein [gamma proteobacterium symbiont of Bathy